MPDLTFIFQKWWKTIAAVTIAALLVAALVLLVLPKKYLSTATALPANSVATDKGFVFNSSIQELYSSLGSPDELDRFLGTARLDTIYIAVAGAHGLHKHYNVKDNEHALYNAALQLKKESRIDRTEFGELQVKVWDRDRNIAAQLANALIEQLQQLHQQLQSQSNARILQKLKEGLASVNGLDTALTNVSGLANVQQEQVAEYERLIAQYSLMVAANPPVLLVVEKARPALKADKPYVWPTLLFTFFAALLFLFLTAVFFESRQRANA